MQTQVLGLSVDSKPCLIAWAKQLGGITYPLLSDFFPHGQVAQQYGVLRADGTAERAIFVVDKTGRIRYVDVHDIKQQPDNDLLFQVLAELEPGGARAATVAPAPVPTADVVLYCTPWCPDCKAAKAYLDSRGIAYVEVNLATDRAAAQRVREWTGGREVTPTFNIRGKIIVDFDRAKLNQALGIA